MMGKSHAKQGICVALVLGTGLVASNWVPRTEPVILAISAGLLVSGSTFADIDSKGAHATKSFGFITYVIHLVIAWLTKALYAATKTPTDPKKKGSHRLLTHTFLGNIGMGAGLAGVCLLGPIPAAVAVGLLCGMAVAVFAKGWRWVAALGAAMLAYGLPEQAPWIWGAAFAIGNAVHCFGDSCTLTGTPWFWPLMRKGKRWANYHVLPKPMRITTGKSGEAVLMLLTYITTVVILGVIMYAGNIIA